MRQAKQSDAKRILRMIKKFHEQELKPEFNKIRAREVLEGLIAGGGVFITKGGVIAGVVVQNGSDRELVAHEIIWWSEDSKGIALLKRFEKWAREQGCSAIEASFPSKKLIVGRIFKRHGYEPQTQVMRKEI